MYSNRHSTRLAVLLGLALITALPATRAAAQDVGFVAATEGQVEIQAAAGGSWAAATVDRNIAIGDTLRTGPDGAIKLVMNDETVIALGEDSELVIDRYVGAVTTDTSVLELLSGRVKVVAGELFGGPSQIETHTDTAVIGVKGSAYEVHKLEGRQPDDQETLGCTVHGEIFVRAKDRRYPRIVEPEEGYCSRVRQGENAGDPELRPADLPPVKVASTNPTTGDAETHLFGAPGVAADGDAPLDLNGYLFAPGAPLPNSELGFDNPESDADFGTGDAYEDQLQTVGLSGPSSSGNGELPPPFPGVVQPSLPPPNPGVGQPKP